MVERKKTPKVGLIISNIGVTANRFTASDNLQLITNDGVSILERTAVSHHGNLRGAYGLLSPQWRGVRLSNAELNCIRVDVQT